MLLTSVRPKPRFSPFYRRATISPSRYFWTNGATNGGLNGLCLIYIVYGAKETVRQLSHNKLHMRKLCTKLVPHAPAHSSLAVCKYLTEKIFPRCHTYPTVPTSPPATFSCSPNSRAVLKGTRFDDLEEIKANTTRVLKTFTSSDFKSYLEAWERRWNKCVILGMGLPRGY